MLPGISHGRNIGHHQSVDPLGDAERQLHRNLATHRMTEQMTAGNAVVIHELQHVLRHAGVIHVVTMRRATMVAQIEPDDCKVSGQLATVPGPVAQTAEQPMQDQQRFALRGILFEIQFHRSLRIPSYPAFAWLFSSASTSS